MSYRKTLFLNDSDHNNSIKLFLSHNETNGGAATLRTDGTDMPLNLIGNRVNLQGQYLQLTKTDANGVVSGEVINAYDRLVGLSDAIVTEANTRLTNDNTHSSAISNLQTSLTTAQTDIGTNASQLSSEVSRALLAESDLSDRIDSANTARTTLSSDISTDLSTEAFKRQSLDTSLENKISDMLQGAPEALDNLAELKVAFESADFEVVRVQNNIINRVNTLSSVLSALTTDSEGGEAQPDWAAALSFVDMTLIDQDAVTDGNVTEPTAPAQQ